MNKFDRSTVISGRGNDDGDSGSMDNSGDDDDDEKASDTKHQHVVKKSSEPGVINDAMLKNLIRAHGPRGEAARLCRNIAIDYGTVTELCLEYQNILKIDHIWMFFNLKKLSLKANKLTNIENLDNLTELRELDLSFNFIKTIKNLECLCKLQYLTLFQNDIRKIDNLDQLEHLVRLNLGNNFIETVEGVIKIFHFPLMLCIFFLSFFLPFVHFHFFFFVVLFSLEEILNICWRCVFVIVVTVAGAAVRDTRFIWCSPFVFISDWESSLQEAIVLFELRGESHLR